MSNLQRYNFKYSNYRPNLSMQHPMDSSIHKRTRSSATIEKQQTKPEGEAVTQPQKESNQQKEKEKEKEKKDYDKMMKSLKKKIKNIQDSKTQQNEGEKQPKQSKPKQKKHKDKKKDDGQKQQKQKKKKKSKQKDSEDQVKDQEQPVKEKKDKKDGQGEVKEQEKVKEKAKKKKYKPNKEKQKEKHDNQQEDQMKEQEDEESQQKPKKKKSKKKQQSEDEQSSLSQKSSKKKKIKKDGQKRRRGRKPSGPIKRKKFSIFQRQQIINKKYRVKKKSHYLNRQSQRAWGPMRAGPYRDTRKTSKEQQRKIIQALWGDGPDDKKQKKQNESHMEIENQKEAENQNQEEDIKIQEQKQPSKKKSKKKKIDDSDEEEEEEKPKPKKKKSKKKKDSDQQKDRTLASASSNKKKAKKTDDDSVKIEAESTKASTKAPSKKKKKNSSNPEKQANQKDKTKLQHDSDNEDKKTKKKKRRDDDEDSQQDSDDEDDSENTNKKEKKDGLKRQSSKKKIRTKSTKQEQKEFTKEQSQKIINLFAVDGGNYPQMMKELPGIRLKKVRMHLRMLFHRVLDIITYQVQHVVKRKIKEWQQDQKVQIVRQLHRIRSSNRLLSESNVLFRQKITALMRSYNDQSQLDKVSESDIEFLYRRLEAFVRGYNTINRSKRTTAASITQSKHKEKQQRYKFSKQVTRKPIISGGHLLSKGVKSQYREETEQSEYSQKSKLIPPQKLIEQWNREQQKTLCQLYVNNPQPDETICDELKKQYGPDAKWRDFQLLGRKIDQLIKYALIKLQNLTARPYSREQRKHQIDKKRAKLYQKLKKQSQDSENLQNYYKQKLKTTSMFLYDAELFQKQQRLQYKHRIFKNLSLLQRQIFGHLQSYKLKTSLIKILIEQFPPQEDIQYAVKQAKKFSKWARNQQKKNNITSIKNIFVGERDDKDFIREGEEDYANQDSIMADIEKVQIIKRNFDGRQHSRAGDSMYFSDDEDKQNKTHKKSVKLGDSSVHSGRQKQPIEIIVDDDIQVSDFQQPQSAQHKTAPVDDKQYVVLQKLYAHLSKSDAK